MTVASPQSQVLSRSVTSRLGTSRLGTSRPVTSRRSHVGWRISTRHVASAFRRTSPSR